MSNSNGGFSRVRGKYVFVIIGTVIQNTKKNYAYAKNVASKDKKEWGRIRCQQFFFVTLLKMLSTFH